MKAASHKTKRITLSSLQVLLEQANRKIDILEDRLHALEQGQTPPTATGMIEQAVIRARARVTLTKRATGALWKGIRLAGNDVRESVDRVWEILREGAKDDGRDMETTWKRSRAALQGGFAKARHDVDKSAKVAMHIVNG